MVTAEFAELAALGESHVEAVGQWAVMLDLSLRATPPRMAPTTMPAPPTTAAV
jgi:hypothetical protein